MASIIDSTHLYTRYRVAIETRERMDGGTPKDPKLIEAWVRGRTGHDDELTQKQIEEHLPDLPAAADEVAGGMWCGFKVHSPVEGEDPRKYVETRQVKAMLRECATVLGITKKKRGSRQVIQHGFEVKGAGLGSRIYLNPKNEGTSEGAIHVMTPQGPRSALKRNDFVGEGTTLEFEVWVLKTAPQETRHIGESELLEMLALAQENGLGANRSQGCGKFDVTKFEKIAES